MTLNIVTAMKSDKYEVVHLTEENMRDAAIWAANNGASGSLSHGVQTVMASPPGEIWVNKYWPNGNAPKMVLNVRSKNGVHIGIPGHYLLRRLGTDQFFVRRPEDFERWYEIVQIRDADEDKLIVEEVPC